MTKKKNYNSYLIRDFRGIYGTLRDLTLRGYRNRPDYRYISVEESKYDAVLAKIRFMLQETPEALAVQEQNHKKNHYFLNHPMKWQDNPITNIWRYAIPNRTDLFYYMNILEVLNDAKVKSVEEISNTIVIKYEINGIYYDSSEVKKEVKKVLKKMEEHMLIRSEKVKGIREKCYCLETNIWEGNSEAECFSKDELQDIYYYLDFLKNVMPFELPYYMLQKNLETYLSLKNDKTENFDKKQLFLFRHRNTINVIDSEKIHAFLQAAKNKTSLKMQRTLVNAELNRWKRMEHTADFETVECSDWEFFVEKMRYNREDGTLYLDTITEMEGKKSFCSTPLERVEFKSENGTKKSNVLFHVFHGVYFEKMLYLCNCERKSWTALELRQKLFEKRGYYDGYILQELLPEEGKYLLFPYNKRKKKYHNYIKNPAFTSTRLHREALKSFMDISYTELFLKPETIKKIKMQMGTFESTWNIKDITDSPATDCFLQPNFTHKKMQKLLNAIRYERSVVTKDGKSVTPLRLQYSIRYDEFRLLVYDREAEACKMLSCEQVDFDKNWKREFIAKADMENWLKEADEMQATMKIRLESSFKTVNMDNLLSGGLFMMLSAYERKVSYSEAEGAFEIEIKCWPEDKAELLRDVKKYSTSFYIQIAEE